MVRPSSIADRSVNAEFDNAVAARNDVLAKIKRTNADSIPISEIQSIATKHGAQVTRVIEMLQLERGCQLDFKNNVFRCRAR